MSKRPGILPENPQSAIETMIGLTQDVIQAYQEESNAVAISDDEGFVYTTTSKLQATQRYKRASKEFIERYEEFSQTSAPLLDQLVQKQKRLKKAALTNMRLLEPIKQPQNHR